MAERKNYLRTVRTLLGARKQNEHRYFTMEQNRFCNRSCPHCKVPSQYEQDKELTVAWSEEVVDELDAEGFKFGTFLGGEPLAHFITKEGITFYDHTLVLVKHAKKKGMLIGVSTNGDYFTADKADDLKEAGLDWITFSLHTEKKEALDALIEKAKIAAQRGIVPIIHTLITNQNAEKFPWIAARIVENGILVNATVVQEIGDKFSAKPEAPEVSLIPTKEQEAMVFKALAYLKRFGLVRINRKLLLEGLKYYPNKWKCDPERDYFLHVGAGETLDVCEEMRTGLAFKDIDGLKDNKWREAKRELVKKCPGCLYRCYYESENPSITRELMTLGAMAAIKMGGTNIVGKWGCFAVWMSKRLVPGIDWSVSLN